MALRPRTFTNINQLATFLEANGIGREDIVYQCINSSGHHDIVYRASENGASSVTSGATAADRAVYDEVGVNKPLNATQITASGARTFEFDEDASTLTLSSGSLLTDGYHDNMEITLAGTASNNGTFLASSVSATVITIDTDADTDLYSVAFTDEGPLGATATLDGQQAGYDVRNAQNLHVVAYLPDGSTSLDLLVYTWDSATEQWCLDTRVGADGTKSLTEADDDNPLRVILELAGIERVAVVVASATGSFTTGYSVWLVKAN